MQAAAVAKLTSKVPVGAGQGANLTNDAAASDGVDFAALLAAQFQGKDGAVLPTAGADVGLAEKAQVAGGTLDLKADIAPDTQSGAVVDPALQAMTLMPTFPAMQAMQQAAADIKPAFSSLASDKSSGSRNVSALPGLVPAKDMTPALVKEGVAEFAANGKSLPSDDSKVSEAKLFGASASDVKVPDIKGSDSKVSDASKLSAPAVDAPRIPDASLMPAIMSASQLRAAGEVKSPAGSVQPQVGASGWGDALGQKVVWMAGQHQQVAELHLNPPHLGPMEVRLTINNDQVSAIFVSHQPAVREAIEAAMPRLREMFADSGMMLGNAMVSSDSLPQQQNSAQEGRPGASQSRSDIQFADGYSMPVTTRGVMPLSGDGRGLVDLFA